MSAGGMYNVIFGDRDEALLVTISMLSRDNEFHDLLLKLRLRDTWVEKNKDGSLFFVLYTRNGGGNRECSCENKGECLGCLGQAATQHPNYVTDRDDTFDSTYRTYWFSVPEWAMEDEEFRTKLEHVARPPVDTDQRWISAVEALAHQAKKEILSEHSTS